MLDRRKECEHYIFDEVWGEYKCAYHQIRLYGKTGSQNYCKGCTNYKKRKEKKV